MQAPLYNISGAAIGNIELSDAIFGRVVNNGLIHRLFLLQRSNARTAVAHTKSRADRAGSNKKLYRQKGTGRARTGDARSPLRKKGWVAFGPKSWNTFSLQMNKKERRAALFSLLSSKAQSQSIKVVESLAFADAKTKNMRDVVTGLDLRTAVFALLPTENNAYLSARNFATVKPINVAYLNPADLLKYKDLVFTKDSLAQFTATYC